MAATLPSIPVLDTLEQRQQRRSSFGQSVKQALVDRRTRRNARIKERRRRSDGEGSKSSRHKTDVRVQPTVEEAKGNPVTEPRSKRSKKLEGSNRRLFQRSKVALKEEASADKSNTVSDNSRLFASFTTTTDDDSDLFDDDSSRSEFDESKQNGTEKRVRFRSDEEGDIVHEYATAKPMRWFEKTEPISLFISKEEFSVIIQDVRSYTNMITRECPEIVRILFDMFQHRDIAVDKPLCDDDAGILLAWSASHGRGLEDHLMVAMKQRRDKARKRILKFQEKMTSIGCIEYSRALRERSCMESKKSTAFARLLAIGDALEAEKIHHGRVSREAF